MIVEGRVESIGVHKDGKVYARIEVTDVRYSKSSDSIYISNNEGFKPGEILDISISRRTE